MRGGGRGEAGKRRIEGKRKGSKRKEKGEGG